MMWRESNSRKGVGENCSFPRGGKQQAKRALETEGFLGSPEQSRGMTNSSSACQQAGKRILPTRTSTQLRQAQLRSVQARVGVFTPYINKV